MREEESRGERRERRERKTGTPPEDTTREVERHAMGSTRWTRRSFVAARRQRKSTTGRTHLLAHQVELVVEVRERPFDAFARRLARRSDVQVNVVVPHLSRRVECQPLEGQLQVKDHSLLELLRDRIRLVDQRNRLKYTLEGGGVQSKMYTGERIKW